MSASPARNLTCLQTRRSNYATIDELKILRGKKVTELAEVDFLIQKEMGRLRSLLIDIYGTELTVREQQVLTLLRARPYKHAKEIAVELGVSLRCVKFHITNILAKLKLESRREI